MRAHIVLLSLLCACGGNAASGPSIAASTGGSTAPDDRRTGATPEEAVQLCSDQGGPNRTDYGFIASYRCPDGSIPLGFDPARGAAARLRNVGPGPDGHVLDLYEVPCPGAPVRIYVDAYHCDGQEVVVDTTNFTRAQLVRIAGHAREIEHIPFDQRALDFRRELVGWIFDSPQVQIPQCVPVRDAVVHPDYEHAGLLFEQLVTSMAAASIEAGEQPEALIDVEVEGVLGALRLHDAIVAARGPDAADPALAELLRARDEGSLRQHVQALSAQCRREAPPPTLGMVMTRDDGQNVWPPSGPGCEPLVRCCEARGLVQGGASVGPQGLACLLAATQGELDCSAGLSMLAAQGVDCDGP